MLDPTDRQTEILALPLEGSPFTFRTADAFCHAGAPDGGGWCGLYTVPGPAGGRVNVLVRSQPGQPHGPARQVTDEEARAWLQAHPFARLRVCISKEYRLLTLLGYTRTGPRCGGGPVDRVWAAMRGLVCQGAASAPPLSPAVDSLEAAWGALDVAAAWCAAGESQSCPEESVPAPEPAPAVDADFEPKLLGAAELARRLGQPERRVESYLRRFRKTHPDCWVSTENPRRNEPAILYRTAEVLTPLREHLQGRPG